MNPTIPERVIAAALEQDPLRAARECETQCTDTDSTWLDVDLTRSATAIIAEQPAVERLMEHQIERSTERLESPGIVR